MIALQVQVKNSANFPQKDGEGVGELRPNSWMAVFSQRVDVLGDHGADVKKKIMRNLLNYITLVFFS